MKNFIINIVVCFLLLSLSPTMGLSQMEAFNYQGIAVDANGDVVSDGLIGLQFSIIEADPNNAPQYVDSHTTTTTSIGHFTVDVGTGSVITGDFGLINWSSGPYYLKVELDADGGTDFTYSNTIELLSVPYAKVVANSANSPVGRQGPDGDDGQTGATGATGATGPQGYPGGQVPGAPGAKGEDGAIGPQGPQGPQGDPGAANGAPGPQGVPGPKGLEEGDQGPEGPIGATGPTGMSGPKGQDGVPGAPGPASNEVGPKGPTGPTGPSGGGDGEDGEDGPDGVPGPRGPTGPQGPSGSSFAGSLTTMSSGVPAPGADLNIYLDNGTNRADGKPGLRFYNGTSWIDL